jgi:hypothetical protein
MPPPGKLIGIAVLSSHHDDGHTAAAAIQRNSRTSSVSDNDAIFYARYFHPEVVVCYTSITVLRCCISLSIQYGLSANLLVPYIKCVRNH